MYVECVRPLSNFVDVICMRDSIYGLLKRCVMYAETVRVIHKQKLPSICTAKGLFFDLHFIIKSASLQRLRGESQKLYKGPFIKVFYK
jgi:hypothetical protein